MLKFVKPLILRIWVNHIKEISLQDKKKFQIEI